MIMYTVQHKDVLTELQAKGEYRTNTNFICDESFLEAYQWLNAQAKKRIKGWTGDRPVWLWKEKPDLRSYRFMRDPGKPKFQDFVLITLDIPLDKMLLSEFGLWHCVLSGRYVPYNEEDDEKLEKVFDPYLRSSFKEIPKKLQKQIIKTWERCLCDKHGDLYGFDESYIAPISFQAIVDKITINQVKKVKHFQMINKKG